MATVKWSFSTRSSAYRWNHYLLASTPNATDGASDYEFYNFADKVNSIPDYSKINSVIFWTRMGASIGKNEGYVKINGSGGTKFCEGSGGTDWFNLNAVNGFPYVNGDTSQINLVSYCHSMTQDAGWLPNLYYYVSRQGSGLPRNFSIELTITWDYTPPQFTVNVSAGEGGTVSGGGTTVCGGSRTITATANAGYEFIGWSDGDKSNPRTITCNNPTQFQTTYNLTAQFRKLTYTVSSAVSPSEGGTVTGADTYEYGKTVTLTATPKTGYEFEQWNDGVTSPSRTITVTGNATYTAHFKKKINKYNIGILNEFEDVGCSVQGSSAGQYEEGTQLTFTAVPSNDYEFDYWIYSDISGETVTVKDPTLNYTVRKNDTIIVFFRKVIKHTVNIEQPLYGEILNAETGKLAVSGDYEEGTELTLAIDYDKSKYIFSGWSVSDLESVDISQLKNETITLTVNSSISITAVIAKIVKHTVTWLNYDGSILEVDEVFDGEKPKYNGATPTKKSTAQYKYVFVGWLHIDYDEPLDETELDPVTIDTTYTAYFEEVKKQGTVILNFDDYKGELSQFGTIDGLSLGENVFDVGTEVTFTVTPNEGYESFIKVLVSEDDNPCISIFPGDYVTNSISFTIVSEGLSQIELYFLKKTINEVYVGTTKVNGIYYDESSKTIFFLVEDEVNIEPTGADTVDELHIVVTNDPAEIFKHQVRTVKSVQVGATFVYDI